MLPQIGLGVTHALLDRIRQCDHNVALYVDMHLVLPDRPTNASLYEDFVAHDQHLSSTSYADLVLKRKGMFDGVDCQDILMKGLNVSYPVTRNYEAKVGDDIIDLIPHCAVIRILRKSNEQQYFRHNCYYIVFYPSFYH